MLPFHAVDRERLVGDRQIKIGPVIVLEGAQNGFDLDGFGEILNRPEFDRINRRSNAGVTGEDDDAAIWIDRQ